jgi:hypothetical protein
MEKLSTQHGKHRHVSANTLTMSRYVTRESSVVKVLPEYKEPEPVIRSTRPSLLKRLWNKITGR